jgi:hypothetical protein
MYIIIYISCTLIITNSQPQIIYNNRINASQLITDMHKICLKLVFIENCARLIGYKAFVNIKDVHKVLQYFLLFL